MVPIHTMHPQPAEGTPQQSDHPTKMLIVLDSEDSEEESSEEQQPVTPWNDLCIIDRVGLNSAKMSEEQVENAFSQIALAFRSDQYTLKQRLQAEEHARNLAEENIQLELMRGRETLETLKALCLDSKRSKILQRLELCLDILRGTVERISNTAQVLGAVHQEARVSRAVELMVSHVDNLKRRHERDITELDETKKLNGKSSHRNYSDPRVEGEFGQKANKTSQQWHIGASRRRVSIAVITKQAQEKRKWERGLQKSFSIDHEIGKKSLSSPSPSMDSITESIPSVMVKTEEMDVPLLDGRPPEAPDDNKPDVAAAVQSPPEPDPSPVYTAPCPTPTHKPYDVDIKKNSMSSPLDTLIRHRHKGKARTERTERRKENREKTRMTHADQCTAGTCGAMCRDRPLAHWMWHCHWVVLSVYLVVLCCVVLLIILFWLGPERLL
ncbi:inositol 1,4,5-triphosphate receptor associated 1 [Coregonus clupeaformis]|uniref:inositol 1,4,5-triphosphate receptor associated 1 n=1 Tax=Coregonus clupeaformis TaxID=59861 RepID=UPI001BDFA458|nr:inositol 1,4,5-triphosphate receptor associated 1 [Coregonus clupeaformis]